MMTGQSTRIHHSDSGSAVTCLSFGLVVCLCLFCFVQPVRATVVWSGDLDPADPTTWDSSTYSAYIGKYSYGSLNITDGSNVLDTNGYIGHNYQSSGDVLVDGGESTWTNVRNLYVGYSGSGYLSIISSGEVTVGWDTWVAYYHSSAGTIHFDNGTLTTGGLVCSTDDLSGTGTINTHGLVSDVNLVFDATHGLNQTLSIDNNPGQNITVNLNVDGSASMGAGFRGVGTLSIFDGIVVESTNGSIGYKSGSTGEVTVDGSGSMWINRGDLFIGTSGNGTLNINNGGAVTNTNGAISEGDNSTGEVTVNGAGSTWTNNWNLYIGSGGSGTLNIINGGLVSVAETLSIERYGKGNGLINLSCGGMLALHGQTDDSLAEFLGMVNVTDAIRYWNYYISDWADITGATYGDDYTLSYLTEGDLAGYTILTTSVPEPTMAGDANHDGIVNDVDAAVLAKYWLTESGAFWGMGDFNDDGAVNDIDSALLSANWQRGVSGAEQSVPEPSTVALLVMSAVGYLAYPRRRRN